MIRLFRARPIVPSTPRARVLFPIAVLLLTVGTLSGPTTVVGWSCWAAAGVLWGFGMDWRGINHLQLQRKD